MDDPNADVRCNLSRSGIILLLTLNNDDVLECVRRSNLGKLLVQELGVLYRCVISGVVWAVRYRCLRSALPAAIGEMSKQSDGYQELTVFVEQSHFISQVADFSQVSAWRAVTVPPLMLAVQHMGASLAQDLLDLFLKPVLRDTLLNSCVRLTLSSPVLSLRCNWLLLCRVDAIAKTATMICTVLLSNFSHPLLVEALVSFLLYDEKLKDVLIRRMDSISEEVRGALPLDARVKRSCGV